MNNKISIEKRCQWVKYNKKKIENRKVQQIRGEKYIKKNKNQNDI